MARLSCGFMTQVTKSLLPVHKQYHFDESAADEEQLETVESWIPTQLVG